MKRAGWRCVQCKRVMLKDRHNQFNGVPHCWDCIMLLLMDYYAKRGKVLIHVVATTLKGKK